MNLHIGIPIFSLSGHFILVHIEVSFIHFTQIENIQMVKVVHHMQTSENNIELNF